MLQKDRSIPIQEKYMDGLEGHLKLYQIFRDYVKHEDTLINNRLSWNLTIQGLLFAAYFVVVQKVDDVKDTLAAKGLPELAELQHFRGFLRFVAYLLGGLGFVVSAFVFAGVFAAYLGIEEVQRKWHKENQEYEKCPGKRDTHGTLLPGLIGGGNPLAHFLGSRAPFAISVVFVLVWAVLLFLTHRFVSG